VRTVFCIWVYVGINMWVCGCDATGVTMGRRCDDTGIFQVVLSVAFLNIRCG
jgi:hypothetical protein